MNPFVASTLKNSDDTVGKATGSGYHICALLFIGRVTPGKYRTSLCPTFLICKVRMMFSELFREEHIRTGTQ